MSNRTLDYAAEDVVYLSAAQRRRGLIGLSLATGAIGFALAIQIGLNANFLAEDIGVSGFQMGLLESVRETCGITAFALLALLAGLSEPLIGAMMLLVFAGGIAGYALAPDFVWVLGISVIWSQGLHIWMPLPHSMALALAEPGRAGHRIGQVTSAGAAGFGLGVLVALALTLLNVPMRPMYLVAGAMGVVAAAACLTIPRRIKTPGPRMVLRRAYSLYYLLSFLDGWRKQIFLCFAGYLLVRVHGAPLTHILALIAVVQVLGWVGAPLVGRVIDRVGERRILLFYFGSLMLFFLGYAVITSRPVLYGLFIVDNAMFVFAMALTTYANRIAPPREHTATLSMGVAFNHIAAVAMPLVGGLMWTYWGHQWPFVLGSVAAGVSALVALRLPGPATAPAETSSPEPLPEPLTDGPVPLDSGQITNETWPQRR